MNCARPGCDLPIPPMKKSDTIFCSLRCQTIQNQADAQARKRHDEIMVTGFNTPKGDDHEEM